uniref:Uroporphyrinogen decarboxylase n=1 Tax=Drosophila virilis TaxID=7244 RepID=DCUP_DROVI|nr:RecName: Full=Uroporphyrinogen decarboxylase; Short=UPD; Short=URO-D [Drosophila virilis]AAB66372.1 uroprophyrinogen decarboxylase [Drosophila virilis]
MTIKNNNNNNTLKHLQAFPPLKNDNLLRAARGEVVDRVPVWVMRQAGRYLPEFQELRKQHDFFTVCRTPELACEVTMQPLRRFDLDASIIFSDILVIPQALGLTVEMHAGVGPVLPQPICTPEDLKRLTPDGALSRLTYVGDAITMMRHKLDGRVPLIGFTGAPWTLMGYMIEGGGSKTMSKAKAWLTNYPEDTKLFLILLTDVIVDYLEMQVIAGAQMLQVFESSAEHLSKEEFLLGSEPYLRRIRDDLVDRLTKKVIPAVPLVSSYPNNIFTLLTYLISLLIIFAKGAGHSLKEQSELGYDVIGLDWTVDPVEARAVVGPNITLQGNLDPQSMYCEPNELRSLATEMVHKCGKSRYIANVGHGITPQTPITSMEVLVEAAHNAL